jgi:hypothetical protein
LSWTTPDSAVVVDRLRELEDWFALAGLLPELDLEIDRELAAGLLSSNRAHHGWPRLAGIEDQHARSSKPVRSGSPRLGRFDSCAAPLLRR